MENIRFIPGSVTAPKGFRAAGIYAGLRYNKTKKDLALVAAETECAAAAMYTTNKVKGAPLLVTERHLENGRARAVICNSGNANTCNADGEEKARRMSELAAEALGISPEDVIVASTGVIGQILPLEPIEKGIGPLAAALSKEGASDAAQAIMTTDTHPKEYAVEFPLSGASCRIGGIAKGSGMIHPNMATMLGFLTSDVSISPEMIRRALHSVVPDTFNMISVDGDTSTNDMVCLMASGLAGNPTIEADGTDYETFRAALYVLCEAISKDLAGDGEGATKLLECELAGAETEEQAKAVAKSVICSSLVKAAMFGKDANWGRVLCAIGYAPVEVDVTKVFVSFRSKAGEVVVCENGAGVPFSEEKAAQVLSEHDVTIYVDLNAGAAYTKAWGCDLTYDYVRINGDYRT